MVNAQVMRKSICWKREWTNYVILVMVLRLVYAAFGFMIVSSGGTIPLNEAIYNSVKPFLAVDAFSRWFVNPWFLWDTIPYLRTAMFGYFPDGSIAFLPLYSLLIKIIAPVLGGNYLLAALTISTLCCVAALILLHELVTDYYSEETAGAAVLTFMSFPTAFFLLSGYTEALFMALVLAFWMCARRRRWLWASFFAALATLTRTQGIILSAVLLGMAVMDVEESPAPWIRPRLRQFGERLRSFPQRLLTPSNRSLLLAVPLPVIVSAIYQAWMRYAGYGTITDALHTYWHLEIVMPWTGFILFLQRLPTTVFSYMDYIDLGLFIIVLVASLIALRLLDPAFSLYIWLTLAVLLTRGTPPHLLASYSRYFLALFPLFILPALIPSKPLRLLIASLSASLQILLVWIFLSGSWVA